MGVKEIIYEQVMKEVSKNLKMILEEYDDDMCDWLHGDCHQWVINNYQIGDIILAIIEYDFDLDTDCLGHALIIRNGKYLDARGYMDTIEEVLEEFDFDADSTIKFKTLDEFKELLDLMNIPYE